MRSVPVSDFIPTLRQLVNVPLPGLMADAIVKAAQTFCRQSYITTYSRQFDHVIGAQAVSIVAGNPDIDAKALKSSDILYLVSGGSRLTHGVDYRKVSRDEVYFLKRHDDVSVVCALEPVQKAKTLPAVLFDDYLDGICAGAASLLYAQPDSDWFNADLAQYNQSRFVESYREAKRFQLDVTPELSHNPVRKRDFF